MKTQRLTIYDIKNRLQDAPYFFSRKTMKFFHQTLKDFSVKKQPNGTYHISAPMRDYSGKIMGTTKRIFDPKTNKFI